MDEHVKEEKSGSEGKSKFKVWLSNKYNLAFLGIFLVAVIIRLYYFIQTQNQPIWWDEADYMATAKALAGIGYYHLDTLRLPGFPLIVSLFFRLGIQSEPVIRFFILLIPSLIAIFFTYKIMAEMYPDKRIALISAATIAVLWEHLFYSNRFQTENFALIFEFLAIYIFYKGYIKKENALYIKPKFAIWAVLISVILSVFIRPGNVIFIPALLLFVPLTNIKWLRERKKFTYSAILICIIALVLIFFNLSRIPIVSQNYHPNDPITFDTLTVFYGFYQPSLLIPALLFYFFLIGILISLYNIWLKWPLLKNLSRDKEYVDFKSDIFSFMLVISVLVAFIFFIRPNGYEFRWLFPLLPGMFAFTGIGLTKVQDFLSQTLKQKKVIGFIFVILIALSLYGQLAYTNNLIESKKASYLEVKEAGLWLKDNTAKSDVVITSSVPQTAYYSERSVYNFEFNGRIENISVNESEFNHQIAALKPKYLIISAFEPTFTPQWAYTWPNQTNSVPVKAYYVNNNGQQQPILIIYELKYGSVINSSF